MSVSNQDERISREDGSEEPVFRVHESLGRGFKARASLDPKSAACQILFPVLAGAAFGAAIGYVQGHGMVNTSWKIALGTIFGFLLAARSATAEIELKISRQEVLLRKSEQSIRFMPTDSIKTVTVSKLPGGEYKTTVNFSDDSPHACCIVIGETSGISSLADVVGEDRVRITQ